MKKGDNINKKQISELLHKWIDEMEEIGYYVPNVDLTFDNVVDFTFWLINDKNIKVR